MATFVAFICLISVQILNLHGLPIPENDNHCHTKTELVNTWKSLMKEFDNVSLKETIIDATTPVTVALCAEKDHEEPESKVCLINGKEEVEIPADDLIVIVSVVTDNVEGVEEVSVIGLAKEEHTEDKNEVKSDNPSEHNSEHDSEAAKSSDSINSDDKESNNDKLNNEVDSKAVENCPVQDQITVDVISPITEEVQQTIEAIVDHNDININTAGDNTNTANDNINRTDDNINATDENTNTADDNINRTDDNTNTANDNINATDENTNTADHNINRTDDNTNTANDNINATDENTNTADDNINTADDITNTDQNDCTNEPQQNNLDEVNHDKVEVVTVCNVPEENINEVDTE